MITLKLIADTAAQASVSNRGITTETLISRVFFQSVHSGDIVCKADWRLRGQFLTFFNTSEDLRENGIFQRLVRNVY